MIDNQQSAAVQDVAPGRRKRRIAAGLALALGATVLSLCVAEAVLRRTGRYATATELAGQGYRSAKDFSRFRIPWVGFDSGRSRDFMVRQPEFSYPFKTNEEGVRDDSHPLEKAPGELRVAVLGDSFVASHGVGWEHAWTEVLERRLASRLSTPVTVLVGGVPGHDPVFSYHLLRLRLMPYDPDVVVLVTNPSDLHDVKVRGGMDRYGSDGLFKPPAKTVRERLVAVSHLARALLIVTSEQPHAALTLDRLTEQDVGRTLDKLSEAAAAIAELGSVEGFEFLLLSQPILNDLRGPGGPGILAPLIPMAEARGLRAADLQPWFEKRLRGRQVDEVFFPVDQHFNEEGYALLAEAVDEALSNSGFLPSATAPPEGQADPGTAPPVPLPR